MADVKKLLGAILMTGPAILGGAQVAQAGGAADAALGLSAFAVVNQLVRGETVFQSVFPPSVPVVVQQPVIVAQPPRLIVAPRVVYMPSPRPVVYYAAPLIGHRPVPVYAPKRMSPGRYKELAQHWKKQYRPY